MKLINYCQRPRGNQEWYEPREHYADCADTCTCSQVLKLIHSGFSGIQTHDLCLVTGAPSLPKDFKTGFPTAQQASVLILLTLFLRCILFRFREVQPCFYGSSELLSAVICNL